MTSPNPYESPESIPPSSAVARHRAVRALGMRHVWGNLILNAAFWGGMMLFDWVSVRELPINETLGGVLFGILLAGFILASLILNWKFTYIGNAVPRFLLGLAVGALAYTLISVPFSILFMCFHTAIGGRT